MGVIELHRALTGRNVLSVYIAAEEHDPTERSSWRTRLAQGFDETEELVDPRERAEYSSARSHLENRLSGFTGFLPGRGWVAFATADSVLLCNEVPAPMPDRVRWRRGPLLGPWLRTLKQRRPVAMALIDSRRARVLQYQEGELTEDVDFRADSFIDDLTDRNVSKRASSHSGVRGETATDAGDRAAQQETDRLVRQVADAIDPAGSDALIVIGGSPVAAAALRAALPAAAAQRVLVDPSLHLTMTSAEAKDAIETAASTLTQQLQTATVQHVVDLAAGGDRAVLGAVGCLHAGQRGQVELLLLTSRFLETDEMMAEELIALVLDGGGAVDLVTGAAADMLDRAAIGVAARLRYVVKPAASTTAGQT